MRVIGITCASSINEEQMTILLRTPVCVLSSTVRQMLSWFFCQTIPLVCDLPGSSVAIRIRTETDPFQHLRGGKCPAFDGKGVTLERHHKRPDLIQIDHRMDLSVKQFQIQCPGLFYGTLHYPNLNLLLSEQEFHTQFADRVNLWKIVYDCLCCKSFSDRQEKDDNFKRELGSIALWTHMYDCRPKLAELQERITSTAAHTSLKNAVEKMIENVHSIEVHNYTEDIKRDKTRLQMIATKKQQRVATRENVGLQIEFATMGECSQLMIVLKNDLESMLQASEIELNQSTYDVKQRNQYDQLAGNLHKTICEIQEMHTILNNMSRCALKVEAARCFVENNLSLQILVNVSDTNYKSRYLSDLQTQKQILSARMRDVQRNVEERKVEVSVVAAQMQELKVRLEVKDDNTAVRSSGSSIDLILNRLNKNLVDLLKATLETASLEQNVLTETKLAWREYLNISSISYEELVSIAAATCATDELRAELQHDFKGFIYERALEASCEMFWVEGVSFRAIFRTIDAASRVKQLMKRKHNVHVFQYIVLERYKSSNLHALLKECSGEPRGSIQGADANMSYKNLIPKVNIVVRHLKQSLEFKQRMKAVQAARKHHISEQEELLNELHRWQLINEGENVSYPLYFKCNDLPKLMANVTEATNEQTKLQARYDSITSLIQQIDTDNLYSNVEQLKLDELRLNEQLKNAIEEDALYRKTFYESLGKLSSKCDAFQFELDCYDGEYRATYGLSSGIYLKLIDHWSAYGASLRQNIKLIEDISNEIVLSEATTSFEEADNIDQQIQILNLQEITLNERVEASQCALNQFIEDFAPQAVKRRFFRPRCASSDCNGLIKQIAQNQKKLQAMQPAYKPDEIDGTKKKIKILQELEKLQSTYRNVCLNNLILPAVDKLHVSKLQLITKLVATASEDLPELGGTVKVFFSYHNDREETSDPERRESIRVATLRTNQITSLGISILDEGGMELKEISENQQHLAFLLVLISFLYSDNCKLFIIDETFQILFDNGIISMMEVFEKHFPNMQFIILGRRNA